MLLFRVMNRKPPKFALDPEIWERVRVKIEASSGISYDDWGGPQFAAAAAYYKNCAESISNALNKAPKRTFDNTIYVETSVKVPPSGEIIVNPSSVKTQEFHNEGELLAELNTIGKYSAFASEKNLSHWFYQEYLRIRSKVTSAKDRGMAQLKLEQAMTTTELPRKVSLLFQAINQRLPRGIGFGIVGEHYRYYLEEK